MNNIFPDIDTKITVREETMSINAKLTIHNETWVRFKRKKIWYEMQVARVYEVFVVHEDKKTPFLISQQISGSMNKFLKDVANCTHLTAFDKETKDQLMNKGTLRESRYPYSEKTRLYIKAMTETGQINTII